MDGWIEREFIEEDERKEIKRGWRILWLLWTAIFGMLPALLVTCLGFGKEMRNNTKGEAPIDLLMTVFLVVGLLSLVLAHFLRKRFLAGKLRIPECWRAKAGASPGKLSFANEYRVRIYLSMVIPASIGIYGFLLYMFGAETWVLYLFLVISAAGLVYQRPNKYEFIDWVKKEKEHLGG